MKSSSYFKAFWIWRFLITRSSGHFSIAFYDIANEKCVWEIKR